MLLPCICVSRTRRLHKGSGDVSIPYHTGSATIGDPAECHSQRHWVMLDLVHSVGDWGSILGALTCRRPLVQPKSATPIGARTDEAHPCRWA